MCSTGKIEKNDTYFCYVIMHTFMFCMYKANFKIKLKDTRSKVNVTVNTDHIYTLCFDKIGIKINGNYF